MRLLVVVALFTLAYPAPRIMAQETWEEIRPIAEAQHEILLLLIEKREFEKIPEVANELFKLRFPENEEHRVVKEAEILNDALLHHNQTEIAHEIISQALNCVTTPKAKAQLHRERAYVYKQEGKGDLAMEQFEISLQLEKQSQP